MPLARSEFFDFTWQVAASGYVLDAEPPPLDRPARSTSELLLSEAPRMFRPQDPALGTRTIRPDEMAPGLHRYFVQQPGENLLDFVNAYGLLAPEINTLEATRAAQRELMLFSKQLDIWPHDAATANQRRASFDGRPLATLAEIFNAHGRVRATVLIDTSKPKSLGLRVVPQSLLAYMWLKFADELTGGVQYRVCDTCQTVMELRSVKHQREKKFCSTACRMVAYRAASKGEDQ